MARLLGPNNTVRIAFDVAKRLQGRSLTLYTDSAETQLADVRAYNANTPGVVGSALPGSKVTLDGESRIPLFWYPDGVDTVYGRVSRGGPLITLPAAPTAVRSTI